MSVKRKSVTRKLSMKSQNLNKILFLGFKQLYANVIKLRRFKDVRKRTRQVYVIRHCILVFLKKIW